VTVTSDPRDQAAADDEFPGDRQEAPERPGTYDGSGQDPY
jgi:hypothetical protein